MGRLATIIPLEEFKQKIKELITNDEEDDFPL